MVLGAGFLGVNTVLELLDRDREVVLIDENMRHDYIPGVIDLIRDRDEADNLTIEVSSFLRNQDVELYEERVEEVRPEEKEVETSKGLHGYDELVLALGGEPKTFGVDIEDIHTVWGVEPAKNLVEDLDSGAESALVIGSGYTGVEIAGELANRGLNTTVLDASTRPMQNLDEASSERILEMMRNIGISFKGGKKVVSVDSDGATVESGERIRADKLVWCGGVKASEVVQDSFESGPEGVEVNDGLSAIGYKDIFAGGDSADTSFLKTAHNATRQASVITDNIDRESLERFNEDRLPMIVSLGDTGAIIMDGSVVWTGFPARLMKDIVKRGYMISLKLKKHLNVGFLP